ncbi:MAG: hypothetical protein L6R38_003644 [Xanthoria sp. 2 TBL-2021]|nr:MAG: hypothetical protein L6R38_003644 [Xanthoria sp. 2 TBL-2021]
MFEGKDTPERTAASLAEIYNPALKAGFQLSPVFGLWGMLCEAMRILGGDLSISKNLVQLLNAIARFPDVTDDKGKPIGPGGGYSGVYWKDLPAMGIMFREYAIGTHSPPATNRSSRLSATGSYLDLDCGAGCIQSLQDPQSGKRRQYDLGRWAFWKSKFGEVAVNEGLTDDIKGYARRAVSKMTDIEETE